MSSDPRLLRSYLLLAEELHFARAAERLNIAQPALSQQIKRLELQLGGRLFDRSRNHVELTDMGRELLPHARTAVQAAAAIDDLAAAFAHGDRGELRLGLSPGTHEVARTLLAELAERRPGVRVRARQESSGALAQAVIRGELDMAIGFCSDELDTLQREHLLDVPAVVAVSEGHPLAIREAVELGELRAQRLALVDARDGPGYNRTVVKLCRRAGFEPRTVTDPSGPMAWETAVRSGESGRTHCTLRRNVDRAGRPTGPPRAPHDLPGAAAPASGAGAGCRGLRRPGPGAGGRSAARQPCLSPGGVGPTFACRYSRQAEAHESSSWNGPCPTVADLAHAASGCPWLRPLCSRGRRGLSGSGRVRR
jgi:DNA-binding transcriptional LysR family regulator